MTNIKKRDGRIEPFNRQKIVDAIMGANRDVPAASMLRMVDLERVTDSVCVQCNLLTGILGVEEIQEIVETELMRFQAYDVAKAYIRYRYEHALRRKGNSIDDRVMSIVEYDNEDVKQENSNKDPEIIPTQRDYIAGEVSKDITKRMLLPRDIVEAHEQGILHFHDSDYFIQRSHNCCLVNLEDMLQNGTVISKTLIEKPHMFSTACNIATQIIAQVASNQYGGQTITMTHLAPFVAESRKKFRHDYPTATDEIIEQMTREDIKRGVQTIQYQILTLMTTNGQSPFVTVYLDINEAPSELQPDLALVIQEVLEQRTQGVKNEKGVWYTPAFPKLIYALDENNIEEDSEYYYLTVLAAKCTAKRMVPDYISRKVMKKLKNGDVYCPMGCRSFLTPSDQHKYYGRFNQGVVTINLVDVALSSGGDMEKFWQIFNERLELCHRALRIRHEHLKGTKSDVAPILWQYGALARLPKGETIDALLYNNYSTISLGYAGLYECTKYMTGASHTGEGKEFALAVMQRMNDVCSIWRASENISYSVYGTPLESTVYKFAKCLQQRFGKVEGITDRNYITNSYHVNVREPIDAFSKLSFEAEFQRLSPGGAISYVEVPNMQNNIPAVLAVIRHIYDHIMYAELNTKSDYCQVCGYDGEIKIVDDNGALAWECPNCGNRDQHKMNVSRRTCGYIGTNFWNQGRTQEIKERVLHL